MRSYVFLVGLISFSLIRSSAHSQQLDLNLPLFSETPEIFRAKCGMFDLIRYRSEIENALREQREANSYLARIQQAGGTSDWQRAKIEELQATIQKSIQVIRAVHPSLERLRADYPMCVQREIHAQAQAAEEARLRAENDRLTEERARLAEENARLRAETQKAKRAVRSPSQSINSIEQLVTMIAGGANGPDDIKRNLVPLRGKTVILSGIVAEITQPSSEATGAIEIQGKTRANSAMCRFDKMPTTIKEGQRLTMKGLIAGYLIGTVLLDHCSIQP